VLTLTADNIMAMAFAQADLAAEYPVTGETPRCGIQEALNQINFGFAELVGHIAAHAPDQITTRVDLSVDAGDEFAMIPDDLLTVRALHRVDSGGQRVRLEQFSPDSLSDGRTTGVDYPTFSLQGNRIWFSSPWSAAYTLELWYVRSPSRLYATEDHIRPEIPFGWERYIVSYLAAYLLDKEESDSRPPRAIMAQVVSEIRDHAARRSGPRCASRVGRRPAVERLPEP
jgi:hypothetical protein